VAAQLLLHDHHVLPRPHRHPGGEGRVPAVAVHVVGADGDGADALGGQRPGQGGDVHQARDVLAFTGVDVLARRLRRQRADLAT